LHQCIERKVRLQLIKYKNLYDRGGLVAWGITQQASYQLTLLFPLLSLLKY
jgi:hypothetical protein